jgi:hypothetical protein
VASRALLTGAANEVLPRVKARARNEERQVIVIVGVLRMVRHVCV